MAHHSYLVGLVGTGVGPSLTPALHMAEGRAHGLDYVYRTIDLEARSGSLPSGSARCWTWARTLGFNALNITHPCKQLVIDHLDDVDDVAAAARRGQHRGLRERGARSATTPTPRGFATGFARRPARPPRPTTWCCSEPGGAGAAVGDALLRLGTDHLTVVDVDVERATALARELSARSPRPASTHRRSTSCRCCCPRSDGVVHCTPTGMAEHPGMPFDDDLLHPGLWVADIVYRPLDTALLQRGARGRLPHARRRPHGRPPGHRRLRTDHRHHPRRRPHVPSLPPPRRLTDNHSKHDQAESSSDTAATDTRSHRRVDVATDRDAPGGPPWPASWAAPSSTTTSSCSARPRR